MADQDFDTMIADAAVIGAMASRIATKVDEMARELAARRPQTVPGAEPDPLEPIRGAMHQYEAAIAAGQHGGVAAAQFVDAVYAVLKPAATKVSIEVVKTDEPERLQFDPQKADADGWGG